MTVTRLASLFCREQSSPSSALEYSFIPAKTLFSACLLAGAFSLQAGAAPLLEETWAEDSIGDNMTQLENWSKVATGAPDSSGLIVDLGSGNKGLSLSPASGVAAVLSDQILALSTSETWTFSFDMSISSTAVNADPGLWLTNASADSNYRFFVNTNPANANTLVHIQKYDGTNYTNYTYFSAGSKLIGEGMHNYSVVMSVYATETVFDIYVDGNQIGTTTDSTSPLNIANAQLRLQTNNGQSVTFGDISVSNIPEPASSSFVLITLVGLAGLVARRYRRTA